MVRTRQGGDGAFVHGRGAGNRLADDTAFDGLSPGDLSKCTRGQCSRLRAGDSVLLQQDKKPGEWPLCWSGAALPEPPGATKSSRG